MVTNEHDRRALNGVCMLVTDIDAPTGGVQKNSRLLLRELQKRGIATFACVRNYHGRPRTEIVDGTSIHRSPVVGRSVAPNGILYLMDTCLWLIRNRRRYDVIHCQQMFGPTMAAAVASFVLKKPILTRVTLSGPDGELKDVREMPLSAIRRWLLRRVSGWVALTHEMKQELVDFGIPSDRITIIYNSTDLPPEPAYEMATRAKLRKTLMLGAQKTGVFVGRIAEEKNLDLLITAWAKVQKQFPSAELLLLGEGGAHRNVELALRELVQSLHLGRHVHFLGHVEAAKDYVRASDVFVLPTRAEGMSNALVEAFACGAAIVASDIPANAELCEAGENSLLVPVGDAAALAAAISKIFSLPSLGERLGKAARKKAEENLSVETMVEAYVGAYRQMLTQAA